MKKQIFIILLSCIFLKVEAQKPLIDSTVYGKWKQTADATLNNDGKYALSVVSDQKNGDNLSVYDINGGNHIRQIPNTSFYAFCNHSQQAVYIKGKDSLCVFTLGTNKENYLANAVSCRVSGDKDNDWLAYQINAPEKDLVLQNLITDKEVVFKKISAYQFNNTGSALLLRKQENDGQVSLIWVNLSTVTDITFWQGSNPGDFIFNASGTGIAFIGNNDNVKQIWYYYSGEGQAQLVVPANSYGLDNSYKIAHIRSFSNTGDKLFFLADKPVPKKTPNTNLASVDVYSYKDPKLQSMQLKEQPSNNYTFVIDLQTKKVVQLNKDHERITSTLGSEYVLVRADGAGDLDEWNWNKNAQTSVYLVSTTDGKKTCLCKDKPFVVTGSYSLSPLGKCVIYYNATQRNYLSYDIASGITRNITKGTVANWPSYDGNDVPDSLYNLAHVGVAGWLKNDAAVLLYSQNDIFQADPEGKRAPINLTGNYGHKHHFQFKLALTPSGQAADIDPQSSILLRAFNQDTKDISFCSVFSGRLNNPVLSMQLPYNIGVILQAKNTNTYIVNMESAERPQNAFLTKDFKKFIPLTDKQPQKQFNWLTTRLITWKKSDGNTSQGILYKPENFDPRKKYPVIFTYYERIGNSLHQFNYPEYAYVEIDIPTYVSNGYLVFVPDIRYKVGYPGKSAYAIIVSAANYLGHFPWVDKQRMGLVGHSFGGFETDYVISHSHLFAAASSGSSMTDFISAYGSIIGGGKSRQRQYELYRDRMGTTPWQRPDLYMDNSPVLLADKITTPVLMMANLQDDDVPSEQGFELFTSLRRLQKKAWLLQYDGEGHMLDKDIDKKDYSIRTRQFFDYYLKGLPPPKWMTEGIPASQKQIDTGYELDNSGKKP